MATSAFLPQSVLKERMQTCESCEYKSVFEKKVLLVTVKRDICTKRNCKCSLLGMALIPGQVCPEGKWKA